MLFVATCTDKPDSLQLRLDTRPAHLAYLNSARREGEGGRRAADAGPARRRRIPADLRGRQRSGNRGDARERPLSPRRACSRVSTSSLGARRSASRLAEVVSWRIGCSRASLRRPSKCLSAEGAKGTDWSGIRNHSAKLNMMAMKMGEKGFFYHSNEGKAIVGIVEVMQAFRPDPTDETGKFGMVDIKAVKSLPKPVTLEAVKAEPSSPTWRWSPTPGFPCSR